MIYVADSISKQVFTTTEPVTIIGVLAGFCRPGKYERVKRIRKIGTIDCPHFYLNNRRKKNEK